MNKPCPTGRIDSCKMVQVIEVQFIRGAGVEGDNIRRVTQWRTPEGDLIAESDEWKDSQHNKTIDEAVAEIETLTRDRDAWKRAHATTNTAMDYWATRAKEAEKELASLREETAKQREAELVARANVIRGAFQILGLIRPGQSVAGDNLEVAQNLTKAPLTDAELAARLAPYYPHAGVSSMDKQPPTKPNCSCVRFTDSLHPLTEECGIRDILLYGTWDGMKAIARGDCTICNGSGRGSHAPSSLDSRSIDDHLDAYPELCQCEGVPTPEHGSDTCLTCGKTIIYSPVRLLVEIVKQKDETHGLGSSTHGWLGVRVIPRCAAMSVKELPPMPSLAELDGVYEKAFNPAFCSDGANVDEARRAGYLAVLKACGLEVETK